MAEKGKVYVAFFPKGGELELDLSGLKQIQQKWLNPRTGVFVSKKEITVGGKEKFQTPDEADWTLLLIVSRHN